MSQLYIHVNLVIIQPLVHKILYRQESVTPAPTPRPTGTGYTMVSCKRAAFKGDNSGKLVFAPTETEDLFFFQKEIPSRKSAIQSVDFSASRIMQTLHKQICFKLSSHDKIS